MNNDAAMDWFWLAFGGLAVLAVTLVITWYIIRSATAAALRDVLRETNLMAGLDQIRVSTASQVQALAVLNDTLGEVDERRQSRHQ